MNRPEEQDYDLENEQDLIQYEKDMIRYANYLEKLLL